MRARSISLYRACALKGYGLFGLMLCSVLIGCTEASTKSIPAKQFGKLTMAEITPENGFDNAQIKPGFDAEDLLANLLKLIRSSRTIQDMTQERIKDVMGIDTNLYRPGHYGFRGRLTTQWLYALMANLSYKRGPYVDFGFGEVERDAVSPMTDICRFDLNMFAEELKAMGFLRQTFNGSHGSRGWDRFYRQSGSHGLIIEIYSRGEADDPSEKIAHSCIQSITIK